MKRISTVAVTAAAAAALVLSGCSSDEEPADAAGLRKNTATAQTTPDSDPGVTEETTAPGDTGTAEAPAEDTQAPADSADSGDSAALPDRATDTTCAQFKALDEPEQQQLVGRILGENPDSAFVGNPNAALGTAKLVCNAGKMADQKVAVVSGIVING
ncbi:hypothetical protein [Nocardia sp. NPDC024068]|uniref:hypothetical protein n=1 Tax=Nocardia sp. NPDC024068 TaxID=3157197 RepID=UPI0033C91237